MFEDVIGQEDLKAHVEVAIRAAQFRQEPLGHVLFSGNGGLGKTHFLNSICKELNCRMTLTQGNRLGISEVSDFLITGCEEAYKKGKKAFFVIDEIHEMSPAAQEELYSPMDSRTILSLNNAISLGEFTLSGATTAPEELDGKSLINRFMHHWKLDELNVDEIMQLINLFFMKEGICCYFEALKYLSERCRGVPRLALKYAAKARDYAQFSSRKEVIINDVKKAFDELKIDNFGLDGDQRDYLNILYQIGKPVGLETIASTLGEIKPSQVKKMIEPYLWKKGLICSSSKGRQLSELGQKHLVQDAGVDIE